MRKRGIAKGIPNDELVREQGSWTKKEKGGLKKKHARVEQGYLGTPRKERTKKHREKLKKKTRRPAFWKKLRGKKRGETVKKDKKLSRGGTLVRRTPIQIPSPVLQKKKGKKN